MFCPKIPDLPIDTLCRHQFFDLVELLLHQGDLLIRTVAADSIKRETQTIQCGPSIFDELTALQVIQNSSSSGYNKLQENRDISLLRLSASFDSRRILDRNRLGEQLRWRTGRWAARLVSMSYVSCSSPQHVAQIFRTLRNI